MASSTDKIRRDPLFGTDKNLMARRLMMCKNPKELIDQLRREIRILEFRENK